MLTICDRDDDNEVIPVVLAYISRYKRFTHDAGHGFGDNAGLLTYSHGRRQYT